MYCLLACSNIVEFIGAGQLQDDAVAGAYVVQEFMAGGTVKQLVTRQMLSGRQLYDDAAAISIALQIAKGLKYLHSCKPKASAELLRCASCAVSQSTSHKTGACMLAKTNKFLTHIHMVLTGGHRIVASGIGDQYNCHNRQALVILCLRKCITACGLRPRCIHIALLSCKI